MWTFASWDLQSWLFLKKNIKEERKKELEKLLKINLPKTIAIYSESKYSTAKFKKLKWSLCVCNKIYK